MGKKSREKGAEFERTVARILSEVYDLTFRRTPLSGGWSQDSDVAPGDIICLDGEFPFCVECKCAAHFHLESLLTDRHAWFDEWWRQAVSQCPNDKTPLLVFKRNYGDILAAVPDGYYLDGGNNVPGCSLTCYVDGAQVAVTTLSNFLGHYI